MAYTHTHTQHPHPHSLPHKLSTVCTYVCMYVCGPQPLCYDPDCTIADGRSVGQFEYLTHACTCLLPIHNLFNLHKSSSELQLYMSSTCTYVCTYFLQALRDADKNETEQLTTTQLQNTTEKQKT